MQTLDCAFWDGSSAMLVETVGYFNLFCCSNLRVRFRRGPEAKVVDVVASITRQQASKQVKYRLHDNSLTFRVLRVGSSACIGTGLSIIEQGMSAGLAKRVYQLTLPQCAQASYCSRMSSVLGMSELKAIEDSAHLRQSTGQRQER